MDDEKKIRVRRPIDRDLLQIHRILITRTSEIERSNVDTRNDRVAAARDTLVSRLRNRAYSIAYRGTLEVAGTLLRAVIIGGSRNDLTPGLVKQTLPERRTDTMLRRSPTLHHAIRLIVALLLSTPALRVDFW